MVNEANHMDTKGPEVCQENMEGFVYCLSNLTRPSECGAEMEPPLASVFLSSVFQCDEPMLMIF